MKGQISKFQAPSFKTYPLRIFGKFGNFGNNILSTSVSHTIKEILARPFQIILNNFISQFLTTAFKNLKIDFDLQSTMTQQQQQQKNQRVLTPKQLNLIWTESFQIFVVLCICYLPAHKSWRQLTLLTTSLSIFEPLHTN